MQFYSRIITDNFYSDQVSDAVLDACLAEDPLSKVLLIFLTNFIFL